MGSTQRLNPLRNIQTAKEKERFEDSNKGEDDHEQPLSPMARLFHEPGPNVYIIGFMGLKTAINLDVFKANLVHVMDKNHRFSSLQVLQKENGSMTWVPTRLNMENHVIVPELYQNMESSDKFVNDYISNLSRTRIDSSKPLWDIHILNIKTSDAQVTCVFRFHHSLGDGMSLMNLLLACSRNASDPNALPTLPGHKLSNRHMISVTSFIRTILFSFWNSVVFVTMSILTAMFLKDTETPLKGSSGAEARPRRFVLISVSLNDIKMVKNAMGVTVNDVVLGVIQAGIHRYLNRRYGENNNSVPKNIRLRAVLTFNLRASVEADAFIDKASHETWGNKIGIVLLPFNMKPREDPLDYVREFNTIMKRKKASWEPFYTSFLLKLLSKLHGVKVATDVYRTFTSNTTLWLSNIPGPQEEILFCGHEVAYLATSVYGHPTALFIHVMSYVDKLTFVVSADEETIPDPQKLCDDLQQSLDVIKTSI